MHALPWNFDRFVEVEAFGMTVHASIERKVDSVVPGEEHSFQHSLFSLDKEDRLYLLT